MLLVETTQLCGQCRQVRGVPCAAWQLRAHLQAPSRRRLVRHQLHNVRQRAKAAVARSTAQTGDDTASLNSLQAAYADSPDQHDQLHDGKPDGPAASRYTAVLKATKSHRHPVQEKQKPLEEYMRLPASQYSVLDAKKIERIDDDVFICYVGGLNFLGFVVNPVLKLSVIVHERGPVVKLLETRLEGSKAVEAANDRFTATMTNIVTWEDSNQGTDDKLICSDTSIQVALEVPRWARIMPVGAIESTGSRVMQTVLNGTVPRFLQQLQKDYELWAAGDESRKPVGTGEL